MYGTPLVEACIEAGTDYCDLTREINRVREMIDRYHDDAVAAGVKIAHLSRHMTAERRLDLGIRIPETHHSIVNSLSSI